MTVFWLAMALLFVLASAFYSGSEMGLYCMSPVRLRLETERSASRAARWLLDMSRRSRETILAILLGTNLSNYLLTVAVASLLIETFGIDIEQADVYTAAILSPIIFVFGDVVPKNLFQIDADRLMHRSAGVLRATLLLFRWTGILWVLRGMTRLSTRLAGHADQPEDQEARAEVVGLLREGAAQAALPEEQTRFIEGVMNLSAIRVGGIMIPRRLVVTVPVNAGRAELERIARGHNYSRLPVVDASGASVLGIVTVSEVLADENGRTIEAWMTPPLAISAGDTVAAALVRLQKTRATMAIVTDPRRGFVGIATLKDVVEEIFGELPAW